MPPASSPNNAVEMFLSLMGSRVSLAAIRLSLPFFVARVYPNAIESFSYAWMIGLLITTASTFGFVEIIFRRSSQSSSIDRADFLYCMLAMKLAFVLSLSIGYVYILDKTDLLFASLLIFTYSFLHAVLILFEKLAVSLQNLRFITLIHGFFAVSVGIVTILAWKLHWKFELYLAVIVALSLTTVIAHTIKQMPNLSHNKPPGIRGFGKFIAESKWFGITLLLTAFSSRLEQYIFMEWNESVFEQLFMTFRVLEIGSFVLAVLSQIELSRSYRTQKQPDAKKYWLVGILMAVFLAALSVLDAMLQTHLQGLSHILILSGTLVLRSLVVLNFDRLRWQHNEKMVLPIQIKSMLFALPLGIVLTTAYGFNGAILFVYVNITMQIIFATQYIRKTGWKWPV